MILGFVLILIVLVPYCIYLYITNKKLTEKITELELENKRILERKVLNNPKEDVLPLSTIERNIKIKPNTNISNTNNSNQNILSNVKIDNPNSLETLSQEKTKLQNKVTEKDNFNITDFIKEDIPNAQQKISTKRKEYFEELSNKLSNAQSQTIELTDYEKKQEEQAIISYQELKSKQKDGLIYLNDEDEPEQFIENLKNFRDNLK